MAKKVYHFEGRLQGSIAREPRGTEGFQWDTVFVPQGYDKTFAELRNKQKNEISMRRLAFNAFAKFLEDAAS
jgi:XTP/dITP diphosphohydrolase